MTFYYIISTNIGGISPIIVTGLAFLGTKSCDETLLYEWIWLIRSGWACLPTSEAQYTSGKYEIRMANVYDWNALIALVQDYGDMARSYPLCLNLHPEQLVEELEEDLQDPLTTLWVAERNRKIVGILKTTEACKESCTIVRDRKTLGIGLLVVHPL